MSETASYWLDPSNRREGLREVELDIAEGADIVMVKPAMSYLDVLADTAAFSSVPVWAYQVSGEYSMIEAAAANGWIDRERAIHESVPPASVGPAPRPCSPISRRSNSRAHCATLATRSAERQVIGNDSQFARAQQSVPGGVNLAGAGAVRSGEDLASRVSPAAPT